MADYITPSNSLASKNTKPKTPKVEKVVSGNVSLKEKSRGEKLKEDCKNSIKSVAVNTVAPRLKDLFLNAIWNGLSMILFPDGSRKPTYNSPASRVSFSSSYNNYGSYYDRGTQVSRTVSVTSPAFRNPVVDSLEDASAVVDGMRDVIREYGFATWATLYDLCGMDSQNWQGTTKYGWTSIESTMIDTVHLANGQLAYELRMPKASPIDDTPF